MLSLLLSQVRHSAPLMTAGWLWGRFRIDHHPTESDSTGKASGCREQLQSQTVPLAPNVGKQVPLQTHTHALPFTITLL